jgi:hypothetical protein
MRASSAVSVGVTAGQVGMPVAPVFVFLVIFASFVV